MADFSEIVTSISSLGAVVGNILTSADKVEVAKYQAEIAKSTASAEEKRYALKVAQDRLDKIKADEEIAQKQKNIITYSLIGVGAVLVLGVAYYFLHSKPQSVAKITEIIKPKRVEFESVPKPLQLN
jgi:hypothetical protein